MVVSRTPLWRIGPNLTCPSLRSGDNYFGAGNRDCLCLTCELNHRSGFSRVRDDNASDDVSRAEDMAQSSKNDDLASVSGPQEQNLESSVISEGPESALHPGMTITVTNDDTGVATEIVDLQDRESEVDSDDVNMDGSVIYEETKSSQDGSRRSGRILANALSQQQIEKEGLVTTFVEGLETRKRYSRRLGSSSAVPQRLADSASVSSSTRPSPTPSSGGMSPTKAAARNTRRAAARGRERTSNMIHNPFGLAKNGKGGPLMVGPDGMEQLSDVSHVHSDRDEPGTLRCTVCLQIMEPVWISNRYIEQCRR